MTSSGCTETERHGRVTANSRRARGFSGVVSEVGCRVSEIHITAKQGPLSFPSRSERAFVDRLSLRLRWRISARFRQGRLCRDPALGSKVLFKGNLQVGSLGYIGLL